MKTSRPFRMGFLLSRLLLTVPLWLGAAFSHSITLAENAPTASPANSSPWENISDAFFKKLDVDELKPSFLRRCVGMAVTPAGEIFAMTSKGHGVCVSRDHGATWTEIAGNRVTGRCETGFGFSMAYPYEGRLAFFCIDGTGGLTLDHGQTWRPFTKILRMLEYADVDWSSPGASTIFGLTHEPYFTVLSRDSGATWQQLYKETESPKDAQKFTGMYHLGVIGGDTLVRAHHDQPGLAISKDAGKNWTEVDQHQILGRRPVHFGSKTYWTTTEGVIVTSNGRDWTLLGKGPEDALYGPYFGSSDQEIMVVSEKAFYLTRDGGQTWQNVAPGFIPPDAYRKGFNARASFHYYGWDPKANYLYASSLGAAIYRLKVER